MKILVTGHKGYIGSKIYNRCIDEGINVKNLLAKFKLEDDNLNDLLTKSAEVGSDVDARPIILDYIKNAKKHDLHKLAKLIEPKLGNPEQPQPVQQPAQQPVQQPVAEDIDDEQIIETMIKLAIKGYKDPEIAKELDLKLEDVQQTLDAFLEDIEAGIDQTVDESLNKQQTKAKQLGPTEKAKGISPVLGKEPKQHPFKGKLVGASESVDPLIKIKKLSGLDK